jgi:GNAT superfamily N-acetyltransferase
MKKSPAPEALSPERPPNLSLRFEIATPAAAEPLAALHTAVALDLTLRYGTGHWSLRTSEKGALWTIRSAQVWIALQEERLVGTFTFAAKKPWAIDTSYFSPCAKPAYLVGMAVLPELQRGGIGRACIAEARHGARLLGADAIRLDSYNTPAGAGGFYARTGFREVGRVVYRLTPLIYFEMRL